jgi:hypothetical protein
LLHHIQTTTHTHSLTLTRTQHALDIDVLAPCCSTGLTMAAGDKVYTITADVTAQLDAELGGQVSEIAAVLASYTAECGSDGDSAHGDPSQHRGASSSSPVAGSGGGAAVRVTSDVEVARDELLTALTTTEEKFDEIVKRVAVVDHDLGPIASVATLPRPHPHPGLLLTALACSDPPPPTPRPPLDSRALACSDPRSPTPPHLGLLLTALACGG